MHKEVKIWMLMYHDWLVRNLTSGDEYFIISKEKYQKIEEHERGIAEVLYSLPEVHAVEVGTDGIRVFLK